MTEIQQTFINLAISHGIEFEDGNHIKANKIHLDLTILYTDKIKKAKAFHELDNLLQHDNFHVKKWAATFSLKSNTEVALFTLEQLKTENKSLAFLINSTIDMWHKGMLNNL